MSDGIRKTNFGYLLAGPDTYHPSEELKNWMNKREQDPAWVARQFKVATEAEDPNQPIEAVIDELSNGQAEYNHVAGWRDLPLNFRFTFGPILDYGDRVGAPSISYVTQLGEIMEHQLHSRRFFDLARRTVSDNNRTPGQLAAHLTRVFDISTDEAATIVTNLSKDGAAEGGVARGDNNSAFLTSLSLFYQNAGFDDYGFPESGEPDTVYRASITSPLLGLAPDPAFEALETHAGVFARLEKEQAAQAAKLVARLEGKLKSYGDDAGSSTFYVQVSRDPGCKPTLLDPRAPL